MSVGTIVGTTLCPYVIANRRVLGSFIRGVFEKPLGSQLCGSTKTLLQNTKASVLNSELWSRRGTSRDFLKRKLDWRHGPCIHAPPLTLLALLRASLWRRYPCFRRRYEESIFVCGEGVSVSGEGVQCFWRRYLFSRRMCQSLR